MKNYQAPVEEYLKLMKVLGVQHAQYDYDTVAMILQNAAKFVESELQPRNAKADEQGCTWDQETGEVTLPAGFDKLYKQYVEQGYAAMGGKEVYGGTNMPMVSILAMAEFMAAANMAFSLGPMLTPAATQAIEYAGTEAQKKTYLPKMIRGDWSGTMCLTEAHCGTDLGLIKTKAQAVDDHYLISGNKIWITYGEHNLTSNIIHLVLAKLPDAPKGSKGISMFIVPKYLENGEKNKVICTGLEKKMGQHGSPTCFMSFDNAKGYLLGEPNQGLKNMFVMMNEARIGVGVSGLALSEAAYQIALAFAKERRQSRALNSKKSDPTKEADLILVHPDIRRQLLEVKSTNIPMRALVVYAGMLGDSAKADDDARLELLTPIIKSFCSERGVANIDTCMQILGGCGYVKDYNVEQYYRDARISMIYEGTNGIQALDLVGRKLMKDGGNAMRQLIADMQQEASGCDNALYAKGLGDITNDIKAASMWLMQHAIKDHEQAGAIASAYLQLVAYGLLAWMWVKMITFDKKAANGVSRYYFTHVLSIRLVLMDNIQKGKESITELDDNDFDL